MLTILHHIGSIGNSQSLCHMFWLGHLSLVFGAAWIKLVQLTRLGSLWGVLVGLSLFLVIVVYLIFFLHSSGSLNSFLNSHLGFLESKTENCVVSSGLGTEVILCYYGYLGLYQS